MIKKVVYNAKIRNIENKIPDITNVATKINVVKGKIPNLTNLATSSALTALENKIANVSNLVKNTENKIFMKLKRKLLTIIMIITLLLQNLISIRQKFLLWD